ncbi:MAG: chorismate mutase [Syntrophotaleaceae bacterium]
MAEISTICGCRSDQIDDSILELLNRRAEVVKEVGRAKGHQQPGILCARAGANIFDLA